ncbi:tRNA (adenosine(37)-N6)-threonylcarbamoyltransferase complex transferase subunit TsaD [Guggenheimella bovis]
MSTIILGIETSCDETAASVVKDGREILSNVVYSQIEIHKSFGGVVPEIASRKHVEKIEGVVEKALLESGVKKEDLSAIAVTVGPGLVGALLVGVSFAKAMSFALGKPLVPVHHLDGHIAANYLAFSELEPPFLALIVSGGHSHFYHVPSYGSYTLLGATRDDALGEAFDKVARLLGLPYPGGPELEKLAKKGTKDLGFPRPFLEDDSLDFSFSGLKSAIRQYIDKNPIESDEDRANIAYSFQEAALEVVIEKVRRALEKTKEKRIVIAGGVASNMSLRTKLDELGVDVRYPKLSFCTDNAAMIASAGYYLYQRGVTADLDVNATPNLPLNTQSTCG